MSITDVEQQQLLIGGEWASASSGSTFERIDPYTGEVGSVAAAASREDVRAAADAASAAFPQWAATPPSARRELLQKAAALLMERAPEIAPVVTAETGGTFGWGMFNCSLAAGMLSEAAAPDDRGDRRGDPVERARPDRAGGAPAGRRDARTLHDAGCRRESST